jgi:hypothetical protein
MIIVLDTNVWLKELALNTTAGAALRFFIKQRNALLAIPEVVQLEVQEHLRQDIETAKENIKKDYRQLLALFGTMHEIVLPTQDQVDTLILSIFDGLNVETISIPFTFQNAHASFLKTIMKVPPSDKSQEFKDGVLWENCLELLERDEVLLATNDKAFFQGRDSTKGLAKNLQQEAALKRYPITIVQSLADILSKVKQPVELDKQRLASEILFMHEKNYVGMLQRAECEISGRETIEYELFITGNPNELYMKYIATVPCEEKSSNARTGIKLILSGTGTIDPASSALLAVNITNEEVQFKNTDGTSGQIRNSYLSGSAHLGHRIITHTVMQPLDNPN